MPYSQQQTKPVRRQTIEGHVSPPKGSGHSTALVPANGNGGGRRSWFGIVLDGLLLVGWWPVKQSEVVVRPDFNLCFVDVLYWGVGAEGGLSVI